MPIQLHVAYQNLKLHQGLRFGVRYVSDLMLPNYASGLHCILLSE